MISIIGMIIRDLRTADLDLFREMLHTALDWRPNGALPHSTLSWLTHRSGSSMRGGDGLETRRWWPRTGVVSLGWCGTDSSPRPSTERASSTSTPLS